MTARFGGLVLLCAALVLPGLAAGEESAPATPVAGKPSAYKPPADKPSADAPKPQLSKAEIARNRALEKVQKQLRVIKPVRGLPGPSDFFLVGKAEVGTDGKAKVEFGLLQGTKPASEDIVDYVAGSSQQAIRSWRPFARFGNEETAQKGLVAIREKYDQAQEYRAQLMRLYQARSICRT